MSSIEFFLHPPSPRLPHPPSPRLPPISEMLRDAPFSPPLLPVSRPASPAASEAALPPQIIHDPPPEPRLPALTVSIPSEPFLSPCSSPSTCQTDTPHSSPTSSHLLLPPPCNTRRCRSLSSASSSSMSSLSTTLSSPPGPAQLRRLSDPPLYSALDHHHHHHHHNHHHEPSTSWQQQQQPQHTPARCSPCPSPPVAPSSSCSSSSSSSCSPRQSPPPSPSSKGGPVVVRRRRGRPPNATRHARDNNWTFVTPTVWEVRRSPSPQHGDLHTHSREPSPGLSPVQQQQQQQQQHDLTVLQWPDDPHARSHSAGTSSEGFNSTFASTKMDTPLSMPRKKRGRKPKMQLAGNSCFVWRDLTARKRAHRTKRRHDDDRLALRVQDLKL